MNTKKKIEKKCPCLYEGEKKCCHEECEICHPTPEPLEEWEIDFDMFRNYDDKEYGHGLHHMIKNFISTLLARREKEWKDKLEGNVKLMGYVDSTDTVQMLDEAHVKEIVRMILNSLKGEDL